MLVALFFDVDDKTKVIKHVYSNSISELSQELIKEIVEKVTLKDVKTTRTDT